MQNSNASPVRTGFGGTGAISESTDLISYASSQDSRHRSPSEPGSPFSIRSTPGQTAVEAEIEERVPGPSLSPPSSGYPGISRHVPSSDVPSECGRLPPRPSKINTTAMAGPFSNTIESQQAQSRYCRAFKQVRSQMLITSSILEPSRGDEIHSDEPALSATPRATHALPAETQSFIPLPSRAHVRFRVAFNRMRNQMLITSRRVETGSLDRNSFGHRVLRPRSTLVGIKEIPTMLTFATLAISSPQSETTAFSSESKYPCNGSFFDVLRSRLSVALPASDDSCLQSDEGSLQQSAGRACHAVIQAVTDSAEMEGSLAKAQSPSGQEQMSARLAALQIITNTLNRFEQDLEEDTLALAAGQPTSDSRRAGTALFVYNTSMEACFRLGYPDRALEIFERILTHGRQVSRISIDAHTINVVFEGLLRVGEPTTAVNWLLKLREHNQLVKLAGASPDEVEAKLLPEPTDFIVMEILDALVDTLPPCRTTEAQEPLDAVLELLPVVRERMEASSIVLPPALAARVGQILSFGQVLAVQPKSFCAQEVQLPSRRSTPQLKTLSHIDGGRFPTQSAVPQVLPLPPSNVTSVHQSATRTNFAGSRLAVMPANVTIPDLPPLRKIDAGLGRRLEFLLRPKKGRDEGTFIDIKASMAVLRKQIAHGIYPDAAALKDLLMTGGRVNNLQLIREAYAIASVVVSAMERGSEDQSYAWYNIEDAVLSALAHAGDTVAANAHRQRLLEAGQVPSANAYAALIATVKDTTDDSQAARKLFEESRSLGVVPNVYLFNTIISKLSRARKAYPALQLFEEMQKPPYNFRPTSVTYGAIVNACVRGGDAQRAAKYFAEMEADPSFKPRVPPYNTMIQHFTYAVPDRKQALFYYAKMQRAGVQPSAHTYKLLLDLHGTVKPVQPQQMEMIFDRMRNDPGVEINGAHWASLIQSYGTDLKNLDMAIEIYHRAQASGNQDPVALEALMLVFFELQQPALMRQYAEQAIQSSGTRMTAYICNLLIKGYALDSLAAARAIFEQMQDPPAGMAAVGNHSPRVHGAGGVKTRSGVQPTSVSAQKGGATRRGRASIGADIGSSSLQLIYREPSSYESMIRAELFHGHVDRAQRVFNMMETRGFPSALLSRTRVLFDQPCASVLTVAVCTNKSIDAATGPY
ncbi:unnamed protein product [Tilletia laevis]|uniref:PROP1-like PPR domain-containing protein n=1 Tax=Tilletia caries TaxID=13290 RepID=A0A177UPE1_9BASI|nr:hypothetical protein CF336_g2117 [Tilletia laevis]KAE8263148.1 hypothetical protein A4X03_0g1896 [Tilletia caries]KAE8206942.1 hypothetical protein CF335_g1505 [Tilletia laevis]CAD6913751.1 unnamed protein product [Tilletia caries]CAD6965343.1 unnamed protein product [Tilletia laevis]